MQGAEALFQVKIPDESNPERAIELFHVVRRHDPSSPRLLANLDNLLIPFHESHSINNGYTRERLKRGGVTLSC